MLAQRNPWMAALALLLVASAVPAFAQNGNDLDRRINSALNSAGRTQNQQFGDAERSLKQSRDQQLKIINDQFNTRIRAIGGSSILSDTGQDNGKRSINQSRLASLGSQEQDAIKLLQQEQELALDRARGQAEEQLDQLAIRKARSEAGLNARGGFRGRNGSGFVGQRGDRFGSSSISGTDEKSIKQSRDQEVTTVRKQFDGEIRAIGGSSVLGDSGKNGKRSLNEGRFANLSGREKDAIRLLQKQEQLEVDRIQNDAEQRLDRVKIAGTRSDIAQRNRALAQLGIAPLGPQLRGPRSDFRDRSLHRLRDCCNQSSFDRRRGSRFERIRNDRSGHHR